MTFDFALRLFTAFACGVAIGLERQMRQRTAGLRTITLVASGACLFVTLGVLTGNGVAGVTQIAAYVVSGVGFLGGGVIMRDKGSIQGINTAATLWCSAAVGVLAGSGHYVPALAGTGVVLLTNTVLRGVSQAINATPVSNADLVREYQITVICLAAGDSFGTMKRLISECDRFASQLVCSVSMLISAGVSRSAWRAMLSSPNAPRAAQLDCATPTDNPKSRASCHSGHGSIRSTSGHTIMLVLSAPSRTVESISM